MSARPHDHRSGRSFYERNFSGIPVGAALSAATKERSACRPAPTTTRPGRSLYERNSSGIPVGAALSAATKERSACRPAPTTARPGRSLYERNFSGIPVGAALSAATKERSACRPARGLQDAHIPSGVRATDLVSYKPPIPATGPTRSTLRSVWYGPYLIAPPPRPPTPGGRFMNENPPESP